jgi:RNA polymerase sigma factor (sigma-70 family)
MAKRKNRDPSPSPGQQLTDRRLTRAIRQFASLFGVPRSAISDLAQEVWSAMLTRFPDYQPADEPELRAWLTVVVHHMAISRLRRERRRATADLPPDQGESTSAAAGHDVALQLEKEQAATAVRDLMAELKKTVPEENFRILTMFYYDDRTIAEIAAALGLTESKVRGRKKRLLQTLREIAPNSLGRDFDEKQG